jgi:hypothetical protein
MQLLRGGDALSCRAAIRLDEVFTVDDPTGTLQAVWKVKEQLRALLRTAPRRTPGSENKAPGAGECSCTAETRFVVGWVAVTAGGALDVFDGGVVRFDLACRGNYQHLDFFPPAANSAVEPIGFFS